MESDDLAQVVPTKRHSSPTPTDASTSTRAPREKKARLRPRYDGNAPDGLAVVDAYERGTMAPSRKKARESAKKKKRIGVAAVEVTNDEVMDD